MYLWSGDIFCCIKATVHLTVYSGQLMYIGQITGSDLALFTQLKDYFQAYALIYQPCLASVPVHVLLTFITHIWIGDTVINKSYTKNDLGYMKCVKLCVSLSLSAILF